MEFIEQLKEKAGQSKQRIVLPEGLEERTLKAANQILEEDFAEIILIGNPAKVKEEAVRLGLPINIISAKRSEEHTSELQSRPHLVCRLLLEKKKQTLRPVRPRGSCA